MLKLPFLFLCTIALLLSMTGCASGPPTRISQSEATTFKTRPLLVGDPLNLSGRPLRKVDEKFWAADSITVSELLAGGPAIDIPLTFQAEVHAALKEAGWNATLRPMPPLDAPEDTPSSTEPYNGLSIELALTEWDTSRISVDGTLKVGAVLMLVQPATRGPKVSQRGLPFREPVSRTEYSREVKLLQPVSVPGGEATIVGESRVIAGRYRQIVSMLAHELLVEAGLIPASPKG